MLLIIDILYNKIEKERSGPTKHTISSNIVLCDLVYSVQVLGWIHNVLVRHHDRDSC